MNPQPLKFCGQEQPHNPHIWVDPQTTIGIYLKCSGYSNTVVSSDLHYQDGWRDGYDAGVKTALKALKKYLKERQ